MANCDRCNGSGELGVRNRFCSSAEVPGPVPEDARRWYAIDCPSCHGTGEVSDPWPRDEGDEDDE